MCKAETDGCTFHFSMNRWECSAFRLNGGCEPGDAVRKRSFVQVVPVTCDGTEISVAMFCGSR